MTNTGTLQLDGTGDSRYCPQPAMECSAAESFDNIVLVIPQCWVGGKLYEMQLRARCLA